MLFFRYPDGLEGVRWSDIFLLMKGRDVDNALKLIELILTLPPTSVRNEATFSAMKLVKTKRRGHMNEATLNMLLLVHLETPSVQEFNPDPAIKEWLV